LLYINTHSKVQHCQTQKSQQDIYLTQMMIRQTVHWHGTKMNFVQWFSAVLRIGPKTLLIQLFAIKYLNTCQYPHCADITAKTAVSKYSYSVQSKA